MPIKKQTKSLSTRTYGANIYSEDEIYIEKLRNTEKEKEAKIIRELISDGIRYRKLAANGYDEVGEHFKKQLRIVMNDLLRPLGKQLDTLSQEVTNSKDETAEKVNNLLETTSSINTRLGGIGNLMEKIGDYLQESPANSTDDFQKLMLNELAEIKKLAEYSARNLIGIRVIIWLYLLEFLAPLIKTYRNIDRKEFNETIKTHVTRLFNEDVLKELAYMKSDEIEVYIQKEVVELYSSLRSATDNA